MRNLLISRYILSVLLYILYIFKQLFDIKFNVSAFLSCLEATMSVKFQSPRCKVFKVGNFRISPIHALELIYFNSNTQATMKRKLYPSDSFNFPPLH